MLWSDRTDRSFGSISPIPWPHTESPDNVPLTPALDGSIAGDAFRCREYKRFEIRLRLRWRECGTWSACFTPGGRRKSALPGHKAGACSEYQHPIPFLPLSRIQYLHMGNALQAGRDTQVFSVNPQEKVAWTWRRSACLKFFQRNRECSKVAFVVRIKSEPGFIA